MALALPPGGHIWCFDVSEPWTNVAKKHWKAAGVADRITLRLAPGAESMQWLVDTGHAGTFDLVFIDADKASYPKYWDLAHLLLRTGGTAIADNTMFQAFVPPRVSDADVRAKVANRPREVQDEIVGSLHAIRAFNKKAHADKRFAISLVPVGDGMTFAVKL
jgi:caffeoyl-CoA O-methyltransferase